MDFNEPKDNISIDIYDVWCTYDDNDEPTTYSFNFEFDDDINTIQTAIVAADAWDRTDEKESSYAFALTSFDKKGYIFKKDKDGNITHDDFNFNDITGNLAGIALIKKDSYSLYKSEIVKKPQIKIEGQLPKEGGLIFVNDKGEPSFVTINELRQLMFPKQ